MNRCRIMFLRSFLIGSRKLSTVANRIMQSKNLEYEGCIDTLNHLQSNAQYIRAKASENNHCNDQLIQVEKYLNRVGLSLDKLDELSVIHVSGTKGKGTTCAFSEKILREHGYKTGFFSSPHLAEVRERIRINGRPLTKSDFARYFWRIYSSLYDKKSSDDDMPLYFRFLTIMAFHVFLAEKVDVAIVEVGIGGQYDCTNVVRRVPVVGITSLGVDHVTLLGNTVEEIAWHKGGIMKTGCRAFTVPQPEAAMKILRERSVERKCTLEIVDSQEFNFPTNVSSYPARILNLNASLAVTLCKTWLSIKHNNNIGKSLSRDIAERALSSCAWPGRFQVKHYGTNTFYLDGAHTDESIAICSDWFRDTTRYSRGKKVLMFNVTGNRNVEELLRPLQTCEFDAALFVTNVARASTGQNGDELVERCHQHRQLWWKLAEDTKRSTDLCEVFPTISEAIDYLNVESNNHDVLVTGSLHLVGSVLSVIDPNFNEYT